MTVDLSAPGVSVNRPQVADRSGRHLSVVREFAVIALRPFCVCLLCRVQRPIRAETNSRSVRINLDVIPSSPLVKMNAFHPQLVLGKYGPVHHVLGVRTPPNVVATAIEGITVAVVDELSTLRVQDESMKVDNLPVDLGFSVEIDLTGARRDLGGAPFAARHALKIALVDPRDQPMLGRVLTGQLDRHCTHRYLPFIAPANDVKKPSPWAGRTFPRRGEREETTVVSRARKRGAEVLVTLSRRQHRPVTEHRHSPLQHQLRRPRYRAEGRPA